MEEPLAPQAHYIAADRERRADLVVAASLGGQQDHPGAENFEIRQRILAGAVFQDLALFPGEMDRKGAASGHYRRPSFGYTIAEKVDLGNNYTLPYL
ncbi:MAG TPA: hypothetical protein VIK33_11475 [Anaerolineae bacterium]